MPYTYNECGTELPTKKRFEKHKKIHNRASNKHPDIDPSNKGYSTLALPSFFVANATSWILGKRKKKDRE
jgi:hypothetical protein